ncbi:MAG: hypothetical protein ACQEP9_10170 [Bacillota bacterium]
MLTDSDKEKFVLVTAVEAGIPTELLKVEKKKNISIKGMKNKLIAKLESDYAMTEEVASWAVNSWRLALNVLDDDEEEAWIKTDHSLFGDEIPLRILRLFFIIDCSYSMEESKIQALNHSIRSFISMMRALNARRVGEEIEVQVLKFSNEADLHVG